MFWPAIDFVSNDVTHRFSQYILLGRTADLLCHGLRADHFHQMVVKEGDATFDGISHLHAVPKKRKKVVGKPRFRPEIERLMQRVSSRELARDVDGTTGTELSKVDV